MTAGHLLRSNSEEPKCQWPSQCDVTLRTVDTEGFGKPDHCLHSRIGCTDHDTKSKEQTYKAWIYRSGYNGDADWPAGI